jgi:hypothetical protein
MVEQSVLSITNEDSESSNKVLSKGFTDWIFECHGFWHNAVLIIASFLFVLYLALQARKSFVKLTNGRSYIIISYYASLWLVSILNLAWCFSQVFFFFPSFLLHDAFCFYFFMIMWCLVNVDALILNWIVKLLQLFG